jgi:hypothetical protein
MFKWLKRLWCNHRMTIELDHIDLFDRIFVEIYKCKECNAEWEVSNDK